MEKLKVNINGWLIILLRFLSGVSKYNMKREFPDICVLRTNMVVFFTLFVLFPIPVLILSIVFKLADIDGKNGRIVVYLMAVFIAFLLGIVPFNGSGNIPITFLRVYLMYPAIGIGILIASSGILLGGGILVMYLKEKFFKKKENRKPSVVVEMYKSWREKYCTPIEYINKQNVNQKQN